MQQKDDSKVKINNFELFSFVFSMIFIGDIKGIDGRPVIYLFWIIFSLIKRTNKNFYLLRKQIIMFVWLLALFCYTLIVLIFSDSASVFFQLRIARSILSFLTIVFFFQSSNVTLYKLINALLCSVLVHSISILGSVISPGIRTIVDSISGYHKKYLGYRSSGLFTGYDFAGYFINICIFIFSLYRIKVKNIKKLELILIFVLSFSVFLTSRFNIAVLIFNIFVLSLISMKTKNKTFIRFYGIQLVISLVGGVIFSIISMNIAPTAKYFLTSNFTILNKFGNSITDSYANYNIASTISQQFQFSRGAQIIWGTNHPAGTDPGYINNLYYVGILGLLLIVGFYLGLIIISNKDDKLSYWMVVYIVLITLIYEMKLSFLFSSSAFELLIMFWCLNQNSRKISI